MKIGDKVRVIKLLDIDKKYSNLAIGDVGIIESVELIHTGYGYAIRFSDSFTCDDDNENLEEDGSYWMLEHQLELVRDKVITQGKRKQIYNFTSSILVALALAFTFCIAGGLDADTLTIKQAIIYALIYFNLFGLSVFLSTKGAMHRESYEED